MKKKMTRQEFALKNPYFSPVSFNPGVKKIVHIEGLRISSVLCVDAFMSEPVWHASGAILDLRMMPREIFGNVSTGEFKKLLAHLSGLINSVGSGEKWASKPNQVLHVYKKLSVEELEKMRKSFAYGH